MRDFSTRIQQGEKRKRCHPKSDFKLWQAAHFSNKNSINKPVMNNRRLLIAAVFHFMHPVEKDSKKHHKLTKNSVSFSCQSKQVSRCCMNFLHELTCQILTNQSIKIGHGAWSWKLSVFPACIFTVFAHARSSANILSNTLNVFRNSLAVKSLQRQIPGTHPAIWKFF